MPSGSAASCAHCRTPLGGGSGGWFSTVTQLETCFDSPTKFHEPRDTAPCVLPCNNPAVPGSDLCAEHREEAAVDMCLDGDHGPLCVEFGLDCEEATDG